MPPRNRRLQPSQHHHHQQQQQQQQQHQQQHKDPLHHSDRPCCRLIQDAAQSIIQQQAPLGKILLNHIRETRSKKQPSRKKKKKKKSDVPVVESSAEPQQQELNDCCKEASSNKQSNLLLSRYIFSVTTSDAPANVASFSSLVAMLQETAAGCRIPMTQLQHAVSEIQCPDCQKCVRDTLQLNVRLHLGEHHSASSATDNHDDDDDQNAFEYITMEEGRGKSSFDDQKVNGSFQRLFENGQAVAWEWKPQCQHDWEALAEFILLQGMPPDELLKNSCESNNFPLSLPEVQQLHTTVENRATILLKDFANMSTSLQNTIERLSNLPPDDENNMNFNSFPAMKDVDTVCSDIMERLLKVVLDATRALQCILDASGIAFLGPIAREERMRLNLSWATKLCEKLWNLYMKALQDMIQLSLVYEERLFAVADRHGKIQQMFFSSTARGIYRELVGSKAFVTHQAIDSIQRCLDSPVYTDPLECEGWTIHFMKRLFAEEEYCLKQMEKVKYKRKTPFDLAFEDLVYAMREWTETVHGGSVSAIIEVHQQRTDKLRRLVKSAEQHVQLKRKEMEKRSLPEVDRVFAALGGLRKQLVFFLALTTESEENANAQLAARQNVGHSFAKTMIDWTMLRSVVPYETNEHWPQWEPLSLSLEMQTALYFPDRAAAVTNCRGGNGTIRATCMLVGLFYRWMSDRCNEWHAEMAEKELLTAIIDAPEDAGDKGTKMGKKAKKKKKKKSATEADPAEVVEVVSEEQEEFEEPVEPPRQAALYVVQPQMLPKHDKVEHQHKEQDQQEELKGEDEWQPVTPSKFYARKNKKKVPSPVSNLIDQIPVPNDVDVVGVSLHPKVESEPPPKTNEECNASPDGPPVVPELNRGDRFQPENEQVVAAGPSSGPARAKKSDLRNGRTATSADESKPASKQPRDSEKPGNSIVDKATPTRLSTLPAVALRPTGVRTSNGAVADSEKKFNGDDSTIAGSLQKQVVDGGDAESANRGFEKEILVGVYNRSGEFESAEAFLLERYLSVANAEHGEVIFWE